MSSWKVPISLGAVALMLSGCGFIQNITQGATEPSSTMAPSPTESTSSATMLPAAKVDTPLEAMRALEGLGVFNGCNLPERPYSDDRIVVTCFRFKGPEIPPQQCTKGLACLAEQQPLVESEVVFTAARWTLLQSECKRLPLDFVVVTDGATFLSSSRLYQREMNADIRWPAYVSPIDIQKALGGKVMTVDECLVLANVE